LTPDFKTIANFRKDNGQGSLADAGTSSCSESILYALAVCVIVWLLPPKVVEMPDAATYQLC